MRTETSGKVGNKEKAVIILGIILFIFATASGFAYYKLDPTRVVAAEYLPFEAEIKDTMYANVRNERIKDIVVSGKVKGDQTGLSKSFVAVISFDFTKLHWGLLYSQQFDNFPSVNVKMARLLPNKLDQVIASSVQGSGGFLSYKVLGWHENSVKILLQREGIFQGSIQAEGDQLI